MIPWSFQLNEFSDELLDKGLLADFSQEHYVLRTKSIYWFWGKGAYHRPGMCLWGEVYGGVGMSLGRGEVLPGLTSFWPEGRVSCWCSLAGEGFGTFLVGDVLWSC